MAASSYEASLARLLKDEGGYVNHPNDPGGPTNWGITLADARSYWKKDATAADVKAMPIEVAKMIYRARYWDNQRCSELPAGVDYAVFDYGVNSGVGRSGKVLRRCLGLSDKTSVVTPEVVAAAKAMNAAKLCEMIWTERMAFLRSLKTFPVFGKGWTNRVNGGRAFSKLLMGNMQPVPPPAATTGKGTVPVNKKAQAGTAGGAVVIGSTAAASPGMSPWMIAAIIGVTVAIGIGVVLFFKWRQKQQQEAPVAFVMGE